MNKMVERGAKSLNKIGFDDDIYKMPAISADNATFIPLTYSQYFDKQTMDKEEIGNLEISQRDVSVAQ